MGAAWRVEALAGEVIAWEISRLAEAAVGA